MSIAHCAIETTGGLHERRRAAKSDEPEDAGQSEFLFYQVKSTAY